MDEIQKLIFENIQRLKITRISEEGEEPATLRDFEAACKKNTPKKTPSGVIVKEDFDYFIKITIKDQQARPPLSLVGLKTK